MSNSVNVVLAVAVCVFMMAFNHHADGASNCQTVLTAMQSCRTYLKQGGTLPDTCCQGVTKLKNSATTTALKRSYCECLKSEARSLGVKSEYASSLPKKCNVEIGYPISYSVNCSSVQ